MDERIVQFRVGVMVFATLIITLILIVLFGKFPTFVGTYTIQIELDEAPGVDVNTPVLKSGIRIGRVSDVRLVDRDKKVRITAEIDNDKHLYRHDQCVVTSSMLGDTAVSFVRAVKDEKTAEYIVLKPGDKVTGRVSTDPTGMLTALEGPITTVESTGKALEGASIELRIAAEKIGVLVDENREGIHKAIVQANETLTAVQDITNIASELFGDETTQEKLKQAVAGLPDTLIQLNRTMTSAEQRLNELKNLTGPLGEGGQQRVQRLDDAIENFGEISAQLAIFSRKLNDRRGSLGQLLNDPELYNHLNRAAKNIDTLTRQMQPIMHDVRIFTDKIARHPGIIVRDAVKPGLGLK